MELVTLPADHDGFHAAKHMADTSLCLKQKVGAAVLHPDYGLLGAGCNQVDDPPPVCYREVEGFASGEGYWCCEYLCRQKYHAEVAAIRHALETVPAGVLVGATVFLWGHTYSCDNCMEAMREAGIARVAFPE